MESGHVESWGNACFTQEPPQTAIHPELTKVCRLVLSFNFLTFLSPTSFPDLFFLSFFSFFFFFLFLSFHFFQFLPFSRSLSGVQADVLCTVQAYSTLTLASGMSRWTQCDWETYQGVRIWTHINASDHRVSWNFCFPVFYSNWPDLWVDWLLSFLHSATTTGQTFESWPDKVLPLASPAQFSGRLFTNGNHHPVIFVSLHCLWMTPDRNSLSGSHLS